MYALADFFWHLRARLKRTIGYLFETVGVVFFVGFSLAILFQVFARYVIHYPVQWTEEISRLLYVGMVALGAAVMVDDHSRLTLGIDFVKKRFPFGYKILTLSIDLVALIVLTYIFLGSYSRTVRGWTNLLPGTGFRWSYLYLPFVIASATLMLYTILKVCTQVFGFSRSGGEES